jgi:hypothetical protein
VEAKLKYYHSTMQGENGERKRGARDAAVSGFSSDSVARGKEGKRGGLCGRGHAEKEDEGIGGPSMAVGSAGRLAMAPGRRARATRCGG